MKQRSEVVISFFDLVYGILRRWRVLIALTVIVAFAATAYAYLKTELGEGASKQSLADLGDLSEEDANAVRSVVSIRHLYNVMLTEYDANVITQMDENKVYATSVVYYIDTETAETEYDYTTELVNAYAVATGAVYDGTGDGILSGTTGIRRADLAYLITAECVEHSLVVITRAATAEESALLAETVAGELEKWYSRFAEDIGAHTMTISDSVLSYGADPVISEAKAIRKQALDTAATDAEEAYEHLSAGLQARVDAVIAVENGEVSETDFKIYAKYFVGGALLGLVIAVLFALCAYVWSRKINNISELEQVYGLNIFGKIFFAGAKGLKGLDAAIACAQHRLERGQDEDKTVQYLAERIAGKAAAEEISCVCLAGVQKDTPSCMAIGEKLVQALNATPISATLAKDGDRVEHLNAIRSGEGVILLLHMGVSRRYALEELLSVCAEQKVRVMGVITII